DEPTIVSNSITTFGDPAKYGADFKHFDYVNPDAPKGGELSEAFVGTFDSFNPYTEKGNPAALASIGYESMMEGSSDEVGSLYCLICSTVEYPKDKAWAIFTMRPEAKFSDGSPLTADDVAFSDDLFAREGLVSFRTLLGQFVEKVEVLDPHRVKYTFKADSPPRDRIQMAGGMPVMSKAWFAKSGAKLSEPRMDPGIGSGPYMLDRFDINQRVIYKRNPNWWGKDLPNNQGRYNFDSIRLEYFGDPTGAFEGFKSGALGFRIENSSKNWATSYDFPALQKGWVVKAELPNGTIASNQSFVFNLRRDKFKDPRVREAIGLMFNFEWSNKTLFYGLYKRINSFWENSPLAATGLPSPAELAILTPLKDKLPPGVLDQPPVMAAVSGDNQLDRGNQRKASALLNEAGWPVGDDGMRRNAKGEKLTVEFLSDDPGFDRVINPFVENLVRLGVDAKMSRIDDAQYTRRTRPPFDFDIITDQLPTGEEPGSGLRQYFGSEGVNDAFNSMGLSDPAVDQLITLVLQAKSRDELSVSVKALDRVLRALRFRVPEWYNDKYRVAYYAMYEHPAALPPYALGEMDFWWYNADKAKALTAAGAFK
ncbi:MAG: ABC transporter substrate-binding protein, partial [Proteobacteria bacterium]|nr:ABC transporter substrate-binding protein [Pseudomonadota bacterium]